MHTRSLNVLSIPPLTHFALDPPAVQLPPATTYTSRTQSVAGHYPQQTHQRSNTTVIGGWADLQQPTLTSSNRPNFFEPPPPLTLPANTWNPNPIQQYRPTFVPSLGTANYTFGPYLEHDYEKKCLVGYQHLGCRSGEFDHKSPEELRLEDYAACGGPTYVATGNQPGPVEVGWARALQPTYSVFGANTQPPPQQFQFQQPQTQQPLFGTSSSLFPTTTNSFSAFNNTTQTNAFQSNPFQQNAFQWQQPVKQQSAFGFPQSTNTNLFGTATSGFGWGNNTSNTNTSAFSLNQPSFSNTNNIWGSQQPSTVFSTFNNTNTQSAFSLPSQTNNGFFSTNSTPAFYVPPSTFQYPSSNQTPTQAQFFWNLPAVANFRLFLETLPPPNKFSTVSFGIPSVTVQVPSWEYCLQQHEIEKCRLAKVDSDPYGIQFSIQPLEPLPPPAIVEPTLEIPTLTLSQSDPTPSTTTTAVTIEGATTSPVVPVTKTTSSSTPPSPLKRGTTSPLLTPTTRSPLIGPANHHVRSDSLALPTTPLMNGGRSITLCASLKSSPRLGPLPASPYEQITQNNVAVSPLQHSRAASVHTTPTKSMSDRPNFAFHHHSSSVLFANQADANAASPNRSLNTPDQTALRRLGEAPHAQRELLFTNRLVM